MVEARTPPHFAVPGHGASGQINQLEHCRAMAGGGELDGFSLVGSLPEGFDGILVNFLVGGGQCHVHKTALAR